MRHLLLIPMAALALQADGLSDLKTRMGAMRGTEPLKASVERQIWNRNGDEKTAVTTQGKATAWVEEGPQGLKIFWSRDQVQRAMQESQVNASNPDKTTPTKDAMNGLSVTDVHDLLHPVDRIMEHLGQAKLLEDRADNLDGKPARLLSLKVEPKLSAQEKKYVKELNATLKVWLGADGMPVGAEQAVKIKGRAMMVISFQQESKDSYRFGTMNGRLVVLSHTHEGSGSGGGESGQGKVVTTLKF